MKTAFISTITGYPWGGADAVWTAAAEAAAARGDQLLLGVTDQVAAHPRVHALLDRGAERLPLAPAGPPPRFVERQYRRVCGWLGATSDIVVTGLQRFRPDLVVFSCGGTYDLAFAPQWTNWLDANRARFRLIANLQFEQPYLADAQWKAARQAFAAADAVFFLSERNLAVTRQHLLTALPNASVVQTPLRWTPADTAPWPDVPPWRMATVGRLEHVKGIAPLLHALAEALGRDPDWELHLYGRGPQEVFLRDTARHLGLEARVHFHGFVESLREIWAHNHLFISPALEEGVPMTIPEAMLCGRPVLATVVGGAEEWLTHGDTGWLCPAPAVSLLAQALRGAWEHRSDWREMGIRASTVAGKKYRPDDYMRVIIE